MISMFFYKIHFYPSQPDERLVHIYKIKFQDSNRFVVNFQYIPKFYQERVEAPKEAHSFENDNGWKEQDPKESNHKHPKNRVSKTFSAGKAFLQKQKDTIRATLPGYLKKKKTEFLLLFKNKKGEKMENKPLGENRENFFAKSQKSLKKLGKSTQGFFKDKKERMQKRYTLTKERILGFLKKCFQKKIDYPKKEDFLGYPCYEFWEFYHEDLAIIGIKNGIIKKIAVWNSLVNQGKLVFQFGDLTLALKVDTLTQLEKLPASDEKVRISLELINWLLLRIRGLLKKQLRLLKEKCLAFFEDFLLDLIMDPKKNFEAEKRILIQKAMIFFQKNSKTLESPPWKETRKNSPGMEKILVDFALEFKESPVVQLHMLDRMKKQMSPSNIKEKSLVIGFGLTVAVRPPGFGNFQFISHYSHGPHVFNLSLVNDRDAALQEGQSKVQRLRIQPSLNFEIDL